MTPEQAQLARELVEDGKPWWFVEEKVGLSAYKIKRVIEPGFAERRARMIRERRAQIVRGEPSPTPQRHWAENNARDLEMRNPVFDPRRDGFVYPQTPNQALLGDPLPGRSALDQRRGVGHDTN